MKQNKKWIYMALLSAGAFLISLFESMIPLPFIVPGAKLGLSNMIVLVTLVIFGWKSAMGVAVSKSILLLLVTGSVTGFFYSLAGAVLSVLVMSVIFYKSYGIFSLIGISVFGSISHNFGQVAVASMILANIKIFNYLPLLLLAGLFTGCFVGLAAEFICRTLKKNLKINGLEKVL